MASDASVPAVNGNYAPHQGYGGIEQSNNHYGFNGTANASANTAQADSSSSLAAPSSTTQPEIPKDEVGWYFVEQYYTTLSRSPEKLYLFYTKRSQFVTGKETEKEEVCVGQRAINDKIKALDFHDCKVRVTNVDSQSSDQNIVIQVVGEMSNNTQAHKKFVQTFVLAAQTNGYFVLNDIFRYLIEDDVYETGTGAQLDPQPEVEAIEEQPTENHELATSNEEVKTLISSTDPADVEKYAQRIDKELEEKLLKDQPSAETAPANEAAGEPTESEGATLQPEAAEVEPPTTGGSDIAPEKPKDPEPTPAASPPPPPKPAAAAAPPPPPSQAAAPKPAVPAAPKTWANLAAAAAVANKVATPIVPSAARTPSASAKAPTPAVANTATMAPPTAPASAPAPAPAAAAVAPSVASTQQSADSQEEWTSVGGTHARQASRVTNSPQPEGPQFRGYIKNVYEHVDATELRSALEKFGEVAYFDIARQKNCAFVDFKTADGYNKATSTPIEIGNDKLFVEERRVRPGSTPFVPRAQFQGGRGGRGGAGPGQGGPRGGFQGPRGNFNGRGRGNGGPGQRGARGGAGASAAAA